MLSLSDRAKKIIANLLTSSKTSLSSLEKYLGSSRKTVVKELDSIEEYLSEFNLELIRKKGDGIWIEGEIEDREKVYSNLGIRKNTIPINSKERESYIVYKLLGSTEFLTMQQLADELFVSLSTVKKDFIEVEKIITNLGMMLKKVQNRGIQIIGDEQSKRRGYAEILSNRKDMNHLINVVDKKCSKEKLSRYFCTEFLSMFDDEMISKVTNIVENTEEDLNVTFSDTAFVGLVIHICITIDRIKGGNGIKKISINQKENIEKTIEYRQSSILANKIEKGFMIALPEEEKYYLTLHLLGSNILKINEKTSKKFNKSFFDNDIQIDVLNMISESSRVLGIDLSQDKDLYDFLLVHVRTALSRLINNMPIRNPYFNEIRTRYPLAFEAAIEGYRVLINKYKIINDPNEIAFIAMHIEASIERIEEDIPDKYQVLVVCSSGIGTSQLVATKLKKYILNIDIVDIISSLDLENFNLSNIDLIVTTIPLSLQYKNVAYVSPFLLESDIHKIKSILHDVSNKKKRRIVNSNLHSYSMIEEETIFMNKEFKTKEDLISWVGLNLESKGFVTEKFVETVIKREDISNTSYDNIAIPHGDFNEVIKPTIAICTLKEPVMWGKYKVRLVTLICINNSVKVFLEDIFERLYVFFERSNLQEAVLNAADEKEILEIFMNL